MTRRRIVPSWSSRQVGRLLLAAGAAVSATLAGCAPPPPKVTGWRNPLDAMEKTIVADENDRNYVLTRMEFSRLAVRMGCPLRAAPRLKEAFDQLEVDKENVGAAVSSEKYKFYKGETYERAMLCWYLGWCEYLRGDNNNARILFTRALSEDRKAVVSKDTPEIYGDDFALAYYWLGRAYQKLGQRDNARIAFKKATVHTPLKNADKALAKDRKDAAKAETRRSKGERWCYETFHNAEKPDRFVGEAVNLAEVTGSAEGAPQALPEATPESPVLESAKSAGEFFTPDYQKDTNFVLTIELGRCPFKYLAGYHQERTEIGRATVRPYRVRVYVDGHHAGEAFRVLDLWEQASTQDRIIEKEAAQIGKAIAKEVLVQLVGSVASYWDVSGDIRHWASLPGRVFVHAGRIAPGRHTVQLRMYDINGKLLPRWNNAYSGLTVLPDAETAVLLNARYDGDNVLRPDQAVKARQAGAQGIED